VGLFNQGCQIYYKSRGKKKKSGWPKLGFKNQKIKFSCCRLKKSVKKIRTARAKTSLKKIFRAAREKNIPKLGCF
jgi:hypothetical protein